MPRPRLELGTWGSIATIETAPGRWVARCRFRDFDGYTRKVEAWGKSKTAAERRLRAAVSDRSVPTESDIAGRTQIAVLWDVFFDRLETSGKAPRTLDRYQYVGNYIVAAIGGVRVEEATTQHLDRVIAKIGEDRGPTVARTARVLLGGMFRLAVQYGAIRVNPIINTDTVTVKAPTARALTVDEFHAILRGVAASKYCRDADLVDLVTLLALTGLRVSEVLAIRWSDVDLDAKTAAINGHVVRTNKFGLIRQEGSKTETGLRTVPLPARAVSMLMARQVNADPNPHDVVFPSTVGTLRDPDNTSKQWRRARVDLGFEWVTTHTFRRTIATWAGDKLGARVAADQLGHRQVSMTQDRYMGRGDTHPEVAAMLDGILDAGETAGLLGG